MYMGITPCCDLKMKKFIKYSLLCASLVLLHATRLSGMETSRHILRIVGQLSCELPEKGAFDCPSLGGSFPLYVERQDAAITQIGMRLFTNDMREELDPIVCNAVERLFLELKISSDVKKQKRLLKEYQVGLVFNGFNLGTAQFPSLDMALQFFLHEAQFLMKVENRQIILRARYGEDSWVMTVPADRELLFAYDKKEHEDVLREELNEWTGKYKKNQLPAIEELQKLANDVYVLEGSKYMIDSLTSDSYYVIKEGQPFPLFDKGKPDKSLQNLLMGCVDMKDVHLKLRYHIYDRVEEYCSMPLELFLGYMQNQGMSFYSATYKQENDELCGLLLMYHPVYNFIHMIIVNNDNAIYGLGEKCLSGEFYTFIPQHNIKSLFNF